MKAVCVKTTFVLFCLIVCFKMNLRTTPEFDFSWEDFIITRF